MVLQLQLASRMRVEPRGTCRMNDDILCFCGITTVHSGIVDGFCGQL